MRRRNILTALITAPLALLSSAALGMGLRRNRRRDCCEDECCNREPSRAIPDVRLEITPITGMANKYNIKIIAIVDVPSNVADPTGPQYSVTNVHGKVVNYDNPATVYADYGMAMNGPAVAHPQNEGEYYTFKSMVELPANYRVKGIARATETFIEFGGSGLYVP